MKIAAFSDSHGCVSLPKIDAGTDVVCIAGDIIPLDYQRDDEYSHIWFRDVFIPWVNELQVSKVIFVGGNHDFWMERKPKDMLELIKESGLNDKLVYLFDMPYEYGGKKFFGSPWIKDLRNWAFYSPNPKDSFKFIDDCDVLITHMPPNIEKVGCSEPNSFYERNFGSNELRQVIEDKKIGINICGHIHTGTHGGVKYNNTTIYNVSLLNEDYNEAYDVTYIEI